MKAANIVNKIVCVLSGIGLIGATIALVLLAMSDTPLLYGITINTLFFHPLTWVVISGVIFFSAIAQFRKNRED